MKTSDRTCELPLTRTRAGRYTAELHGMQFEFVDVSGEIPGYKGWHLYVDGECTDRYLTLRAAVDDAIQWALEYGN